MPGSQRPEVDPLGNVDFRRSQVTGKKTGYARNAPAEWVVLQNHHEPLIERKAEQVRRARAGKAGCERSVRLVYPLRSLAHCAACGGALQGFSSKAKGREYRKYCCSSYRKNKQCANFTIDAAPLESAILGS